MPEDSCAHPHIDAPVQSLEHEPKRNLQRRLAVAIGIAAVVAGIEVLGSVASGSLALLTDAGHIATDAFALGLSLAALRLSTRPHTAKLSFGYHRVEVLAALANAALLVVVAVYLAGLAYARYSNPVRPDVAIMLLVGLGGLAGNLTMAFLLRSWARVNINAQGAFLHAYGDVLGSGGVVVAAVFVQLTGNGIADLLFSVFILALISFSAGRLLRDTVAIILEASPRGISPQEVAGAVSAIPGVRGVHDLHIWTMTSGLVVLTGHVLVAGESTVQGAARIVDAIRDMLRSRFQIAHATLQVDSATETMIPATDLTRSP
jgi:cobalt-zinc-cadmium efflux system protein